MMKTFTSQHGISFLL